MMIKSAKTAGISRAAAIAIVVVVILVVGGAIAAFLTMGAQQQVVTTVIERVETVVTTRVLPGTTIVETIRQVQTVTARVEPIIFCASMEITGGRFAEDGRIVANAYKLWEDYINQQGGLLGRPVIVKIYDDASDPDRAVANYERCVTVDKAHFLLGEFGSPLVYPTIAVSEKYKMVYISPAGGAEKIFTERKPKYYFFAQPGPVSSQIESFFDLIQSLPKDRWPKKLAFAHGEDIFGRTLHEASVKAADKLGIEVVYDEPLQLGLPDYTPVAAAIKASGADAVLASGTLADNANLLRAFQQVGYDPAIVWLDDGPNDPAWVAEVGELAEGVFGQTGWSPKAKTYQNDLFVKLWKERYGTLPPAGAAEAWNVVQIYEQAIKATKSLDNTVIRDWIREMSAKGGIPTVSGYLKFDEFGRPIGKVMVVQVINGEVEIVWPTDFATKQVQWPIG